MIDRALKQAEDKMAKAIEVTREEFVGVRTGRASPALGQSLTVDYYGAPTPLQQPPLGTTPPGPPSPPQGFFLPPRTPDPRSPESKKRSGRATSGSRRRTTARP